MALYVYRFRLKLPVIVSQLEVEVGTVVSISDYSGGGVVDVECDDAFAQDLTDAMDARGYEFVEGSPVTTADEKFRYDNDIAGMDGDASLVKRAIFMVGGGLVYNTDGDVLIKVNQ
jgi:hypothetical protein